VFHFSTCLVIVPENVNTHLKIFVIDTFLSRHFTTQLIEKNVSIIYFVCELLYRHVYFKHDLSFSISGGNQGTCANHENSDQERWI
jgi:hypothetical protein